MSNRICFKSEHQKDLSSIELPIFFKGISKYDKERNLIVTLIKTIEVYGDRYFGIEPDTTLRNQLETWATQNQLVLTTDYDEPY